jgi:hypothetical protein
MRVLVATVTAMLLVALAATAAGAAPARSAKLTGPEEKWAKPVIDVLNLMNQGLSVVYAQTTVAGGKALIPGTKANKALLITLGNFVDCSRAMKAVGAPPTARLKPFAGSMTSGCDLLGKGSHGIANGISTIYKLNNGKLGAAQVNAGLKQLGAGQKKLVVAARQLQALGRK